MHLISFGLMLEHLSTETHNVLCEFIHAKISLIQDTVFPKVLLRMAVERAVKVVKYGS